MLDSIKFLVVHFKDSGALWNKILRLPPPLGGSSMLAKLRKHSSVAESAALLLAEGHALAAAVSRDATSLTTASAALAKYHEAYKLAPREPLVLLCAGVSVNTPPSLVPLWAPISITVDTNGTKIPSEYKINT